MSAGATHSVKDLQSSTSAAGGQTDRWSFKTLRTAFLVLLTLSCAYVSSYYALSRYAQRVHPIGREKDFLYVPLDPKKVVRSNSLFTIHGLLTYYYYPIWSIDHEYFDGPDYWVPRY